MLHLRRTDNEAKLLKVFCEFLQVIERIISSKVWPRNPPLLMIKVYYIVYTKVGAFCDITLAVEGVSLKCHKMVLAAFSPYFHNVLLENTGEHPVVLLEVHNNSVSALDPL